MNIPRYSYHAINDLYLGDTGHFLYLDAWTIALIGSMLSQERALGLWMNDQYPLTLIEIDELDNRLSTAQGQIMNSLVGMIMPICTENIPQGMLLCDGSIYNRIDYPNLYDAIDIGYRIDADTFTVPDMRDRFVMGSSEDHLTNSVGGSFEHIQTVGELASHTHGNDPHSHSEITATPIVVTVGLEPPVPSAIASVGATGLSSVVVHTAGASEPMNITNSFIALRYAVVAL